MPEQRNTFGILHLIKIRRQIHKSRIKDLSDKNVDITVIFNINHLMLDTLYLVSFLKLQQNSMSSYFLKNLLLFKEFGFF